MLSLFVDISMLVIVVKSYLCLHDNIILHIYK